MSRVESDVGQHAHLAARMEHWHDRSLAHTSTQPNAPTLIWGAWLGPLPTPGYLSAAFRTVRERNAGGADVRLVRDADVPHLLTHLHPAFPYLSCVRLPDPWVSHTC
eukprot:711666-Prymnesium_polylepis.1